MTKCAVTSQGSRPMRLLQGMLIHWWNRGLVGDRNWPLMSLSAAVGRLLQAGFWMQRWLDGLRILLLPHIFHCQRVFTHTLPVTTVASAATPQSSQAVVSLAIRLWPPPQTNILACTASSGDSRCLTKNGSKFSIVSMIPVCRHFASSGTM